MVLLKIDPARLQTVTTSLYPAVWLGAAGIRFFVSGLSGDTDVLWPEDVCTLRANFVSTEFWEVRCVGSTSESPDRAPFGPFFPEKRHISVRAATLAT